jgi:membrane protein DedA with SNARE-associated domain
VEETLLGWLARFSYPAVFALLIGTGLGLPIAEELVLLSAGLLSAQGHALLLPMIVLCWAGLVASDTLLFRAGRAVGCRATGSGRLATLLKPERLAWAQAHFARWGALTVVAARFLPGLRSPTFIVAGACQLTPRQFLLADGSAAAVWVTLLVWLGSRFGVQALTQVKAGGRYLVLTALLAAAVALLVKRMRTVRKIAQAR